MPRIRCRYLDCARLDDGYCSAASILLDPEEGCLTYTGLDDGLPVGEWEDDDLDDFWDMEEESYLGEEEDELWLDEEDL
jgi:hypothetical protein